MIDEPDSARARLSSLRLARIILPFATREKRWYVGAFLLLPLASLVPVTLPRVVREIVDHRLPEGLSRGLLFFIGLLVLLVVLDAAVQTAFAFILRSIGLRIMRNLRADLFAHVERLPLEFFRKESRGRIVARLTTDLDQIDQMFATGSVMLISDFVAFIVTGFAMVSFSPRLGLASLVVFPFVAFTVIWLSVKLRLILRESRRLTARMNGFAQEALSAHDVIATLGANQDFLDRFDRISEDYEMVARRSNRYEAAFFASIDFFSSVAVAVIVFAAVGIEGVTVGVLIAMTQYIQQFFAPLRGLSSRYATFQQAMVALERVHSLRETPIEAHYGEGDGDSIDKTPRARTTERMEVRGLTFAYRPGEPVLSKVDLTVAPREHVALFGETGTGKSTLARILTGFYIPSAGNVMWGERDLGGISLAERRRIIALAPQEVFMFDTSLEKNVTLGRAISPEKWAKISSSIGLDAIERRSSEGESLGEWGRRLSEGEKQLIAAARVLAYDPELVVLDEATSSLDPLLEARVRDAMRAALSGRSALIIAHRPSTLESADRIAVMHDGTIVEEGTHNELYAKGGRYCKMRRLMEISQRASSASPAAT